MFVVGAVAVVVDVCCLWFAVCCCYLMFRCLLLVLAVVIKCGSRHVVCSLRLCVKVARVSLVVVVAC